MKQHKGRRREPDPAAAAWGRPASSPGRSPPSGAIWRPYPGGSLRSRAGSAGATARAGRGRLGNTLGSAGGAQVVVAHVEVALQVLNAEEVAAARATQP